MTEKNETNLKAPKFKVNDRVRITKYKKCFSKSYTENSSREIFNIDSVLKTNPWTYKIKKIRFTYVQQLVTQINLFKLLIKN